MWFTSGGCGGVEDQRGEIEEEEGEQKKEEKEEDKEEGRGGGEGWESIYNTYANSL